MPPSFIDSLDAYQLQRHLDQHYIFAQSNGIALLKMFLTSKVEENEQMIKSVCDPALIEFYGGQNSEANRRGFDAEIREQAQIFEQKFTKKYTDHHDLYIVRRYFYQKSGLSAQQEKRHHGHDEEEELETIDPSKNGKTDGGEEPFVTTCHYKFKQDLEAEDIGIDYRGANGQIFSQISKEDREQRLREEQYEKLRKKKVDPSGAGLSMKEKRKDGFLNKEIRSLTVAAFL